MIDALPQSLGDDPATSGPARAAPVGRVITTVPQVRLGRDYDVRVAGNDYSVDPVAVGHLVDVRAHLTQMTVTRESRRLATHGRIWASPGTVTDPTAVQAAARLTSRCHQPFV